MTLDVGVDDVWPGDDGIEETAQLLPLVVITSKFKVKYQECWRCSQSFNHIDATSPLLYLVDKETGMFFAW